MSEALCAQRGLRKERALELGPEGMGALQAREEGSWAEGVALAEAETHRWESRGVQCVGRWCQRRRPARGGETVGKEQQIHQESQPRARL